MTGMDSYGKGVMGVLMASYGKGLMAAGTVHLTTVLIVLAIVVAILAILFFIRRV
jgi:hypothetical protein